jgi:hypothetical protein
MNRLLIQKAASQANIIVSCSVSASSRERICRQLLSGKYQDRKPKFVWIFPDFSTSLDLEFHQDVTVVIPVHEQN